MTGSRIVRAAYLSLGLIVAAAASTWAQSIPPELAGRLNSEQERVYLRHAEARNRYERQLDGYWAEVEQRRSARRAKIKAGQSVGRDDYVQTFPPAYQGPALPRDITDIIARVERDKPRPPVSDIATLSDFLSNAKAHYGFVPERIADIEFKRRYAREALAVGFNRDQIVRVYALETGGRGAFDMQAKNARGEEISTALGYAQLLSANSVNELARMGPTFALRLERLAGQRGITSERAASLRRKAAGVRAMTRDVRRQPYDWSAHQAYANTPKGMAVHALNLDGDVGPWLQVYKLLAIRELAEKSGRMRLSGAELELMNLAGPGTGLEMMQPVARGMPTPNFFARKGYGRNSIVRDRTAAELLAMLDERMNENMRNPGSVEFVAVFDRLAAEGVRPASNPPRLPPEPTAGALSRTAPQSPLRPATAPPRLSQSGPGGRPPVARSTPRDIPDLLRDVEGPRRPARASAADPDTVRFPGGNGQ
jgi:hypothetical protein